MEETEDTEESIVCVISSSCWSTISSTDMSLFCWDSLEIVGWIEVWSCIEFAVFIFPLLPESDWLVECFVVTPS